MESPFETESSDLFNLAGKTKGSIAYCKTRQGNYTFRRNFKDQEIDRLFFFSMKVVSVQGPPTMRT